MDDLISRQDAIDKLRNNITYMQAFGCDRAITLIRELPSAEKRGHWIPCTERLPELGKPVLVTSVGKYQRFVGVDWIDSWTERWNQSVEVVAWMPLPKAYEVTE